jgi:hypothetical protein
LLLLVLVSQRGQVLAAAEAVSAAADALAVEVILVAALAQHQLSPAVAFEQHRLSAVHTLPAEALADQVRRLDSIMVVVG